MSAIQLPLQFFAQVMRRDYGSTVSLRVRIGTDPETGDGLYGVRVKENHLSRDQARRAAKKVLREARAKRAAQRAR